MSFADVTLELLEGFGTNCLLFAITLVCALPLGLLVSFGTMCKFSPVRWFVKGIVWIIRGTPLMLQIIVVFYVPGLLFNAPMQSRMFAVCIAFVINYACYFSEIYRGGIQGIAKGQYEAARVLGMTRVQTFRRIVLPQVVKRILPPMSNEIITLVKDTSLARVISVGEIILAAQQIVNGKVILYPLFYTGAFFLIFNGALTLLFGFLEKKLNYYR